MARYWLEKGRWHMKVFSEKEVTHYWAFITYVREPVHRILI